MPTLVVTMPDGRRMRLSGPTREAVQERAQVLASSAADPDGMGDIWRMQAGIPPPGWTPDAERGAPMTLPLGMGQINAPKALSGLVRSASSIPAETSMPIVGATLATAAAPATAGASLLAAAAGGGLGGAAAASDEPGADAESVFRASVESAGEMALAQLAGMGLGAVAKRVVAPNLKYLDPLRPVRAEISRLSGQVMEGQTAKQIVAAWNRLPASKRSAVSPATRKVVESLSVVTSHMAMLGKAVDHPIGGEIAETMAVPVVAAVFGPTAALALSVGKALVSPGPIQRYLANGTLPNPVVRGIADQATKLGLRAYMGQEDETEEENVKRQ